VQREAPTPTITGFFSLKLYTFLQQERNNSVPLYREPEMRLVSANLVDKNLNLSNEDLAISFYLKEAGSSPGISQQLQDSTRSTRSQLMSHRHNNVKLIAFQEIFKSSQRSCDVDFVF